MPKRDNMMLNLTKLIEITPDKAVAALDIEGAPMGVNQISCVNGLGKETVNQYGTKENCLSPGTLNEDQRKIIQNVLKKVQILVGYNISSDITALAKQNIDVSLNIVIVDLFLTMQYLVDQGVIDTSRLPNMTLKGVAEYYGIKDVTGYHDSRVDAKVTMRIFHTMYKTHQGLFWTMTGRKNAAIAKGEWLPKSIADKEDAVMENKMIDWAQDYSNESEIEVYKSPSGIYEALVPIKGMDRIIRMSKDEYDTYLNLRKMAPGYPLRVFYLTILAPGIRCAILSHIEEKKKMQEAADNSPAVDISPSEDFSADIDMEPAFAKADDETYMPELTRFAEHNSEE